MKTKNDDLSEGVPNPDDLNPPSQKNGTNQTRKVDPSKDGTNQLRTIGLMKKSSDFDHNDRINPFCGMESNPAVSESQRRFMEMCEHNPSKARGKCPSKAVASEFDHR